MYLSIFFDGDCDDDDKSIIDLISWKLKLKQHGRGQFEVLNRTLSSRLPHSLELNIFNLSVVTFFFFLRFFFWYGPVLESLLNLLQYCFCFMFWFFGREACGLLAPWPGIEPARSALEGEVLTTGPPGKSPVVTSLVAGTPLSSYQMSLTRGLILCWFVFFRWWPSLFFLYGSF